METLFDVILPLEVDHWLEPADLDVLSSTCLDALLPSYLLHPLLRGCYPLKLPSSPPGSPEVDGRVLVVLAQLLRGGRRYR